MWNGVYNLILILLKKNNSQNDQFMTLIFPFILANFFYNGYVLALQVEQNLGPAIRLNSKHSKELW